MYRPDQLPTENHPEEALPAVVALRLAADNLERNAVKCALEQEWTWAEIAEALGVSRQAAHQRHAADNEKTSRRRRTPQ